MKLKNILISIGFTLLFLIGIYFSYIKFYPKIINPNIKSQKLTNLNSMNSGIYFESNEKFYIANADNSSSRFLLPDLVQTNENQNKNENNSNITSKGKYFLKTDQISANISANIYFEDIKTKKVTAITNVSYPEKVTDFNISPNQNLIVFNYINTSTNEANISICKANGSNLLQLTNDGISYFPVFSPQNDQIAFWRKDMGIYIINTDKSNLIKILNFDAKIDHIFAWRINEL